MSNSQLLRVSVEKLPFSVGGLKNLQNEIKVKNIHKTR